MDIFGIKRRREARERAEREAAERRKMVEENAVWDAGINRDRSRSFLERRRENQAARGSSASFDAGSSYSPFTDILSPLNPASPLSVYNSPSYDSGSSCSSSSDSGSSSSSDSGSSSSGCD